MRNSAVIRQNTHIKLRRDTLSLTICYLVYYLFINIEYIKNISINKQTKTNKHTNNKKHTHIHTDLKEWRVDGVLVEASALAVLDEVHAVVGEVEVACPVVVGCFEE